QQPEPGRRDDRGTRRQGLPRAPGDDHVNPDDDDQYHDPNDDDVDQHADHHEHLHDHVLDVDDFHHRNHADQPGYFF
ncbi:MAG TPA: hypothetical protein VEP49_22015, partial [Acidimicrobiia bacterium]|nr:hypothetical protein [Acidimicrobiia bacterium]